MKRKDLITELKGMQKDALLDRARTLAEELMKLRFRKASGQLEQRHRIREVRRTLARVKTMISQQAAQN